MSARSDQVKRADDLAPEHDELVAQHEDLGIFCNIVHLVGADRFGDAAHKCGRGRRAPRAACMIEFVVPGQAGGRVNGPFGTARG